AEVGRGGQLAGEGRHGRQLRGHRERAAARGGALTAVERRVVRRLAPLEQPDVVRRVVGRVHLGGRGRRQVAAQVFIVLERLRADGRGRPARRRRGGRGHAARARRLGSQLEIFFVASGVFLPAGARRLVGGRRQLGRGRPARARRRGRGRHAPRAAGAHLTPPRVERDEEVAHVHAVGRAQVRGLD